MTAAWISEMQRGDMSHFDSFYRETRKAVFYNIFSYVRDYALSEDVLQETYVRFLEKSPIWTKERTYWGISSFFRAISRWTKSGSEKNRRNGKASKTIGNTRTKKITPDLKSSKSVRNC